MSVIEMDRIMASLSYPAFSCIALERVIEKIEKPVLAERLRGIQEEMISRLTIEQRAEVIKFRLEHYKSTFE